MAHRVIGRWIVVAALAAGAAGCGSEEERAREQRRAPAHYCDVDGAEGCPPELVCGAGLTCSEGCCLPACATEAECEGAFVCGPLGCVCDEGACRARVCSADEECGAAQACAAGACVPAPDPSSAASCRAEPRYGAIHEDEPLAIRVKAYGADGEPLPLASGFSFSSSDEARATVGADGVARGGAEDGEVSITATVGGASCPVELTNHRALGADELRVVLVDELSGLPIAGATVQIETGATPLALTTDAEGRAVFSAAALPPAPRTISAFDAEHAWLTVAATSERDLLLPLRRLVPDDLAGGFRGTFGPDELFHPDHVHAGLAGASIPGNLVDLSFSVLLGPSRLTRVTLGTERDVRLPSGVVLGLGNTWFKEEYAALGVPGTCADRARTEAGTCGTRTAWGLAGGVPLLDLPIDELTEGGTDVPPGELLAELLPHFRRFRSAVERDVEFDLLPTVVEGGERVPDFASFERVDLEARQRMALKTTVALPLLPEAEQATVDGALLLGGADAAGRGVVPLGITAGIDADTSVGEVPDRRVNDLEGESTGELGLRLAPLHGGLEGSEYVFLAVAANFAGMASDGRACTAEERSGCPAISALVARRTAVAFEERIALDAEPFVGLAEDAAWDPATRTYARGAPVEGDASVYRLRLRGAQGRTWHVWLPASATGFTLPVPSVGDDRAPDSRATVQAMRADATLDDLVRFDGTDLARLTELVRGFSSVELPR